MKKVRERWKGRKRKRKRKEEGERRKMVESSLYAQYDRHIAIRFKNSHIQHI